MQFLQYVFYSLCMSMYERASIYCILILHWPEPRNYFLAIFIQVDDNKKDVNVTKWHCPCLVAHALIYAYKMNVVSSALPYTFPNKKYYSKLLLPLFVCCYCTILYHCFFFHCSMTGNKILAI